MFVFHALSIEIQISLNSLLRSMSHLAPKQLASCLPKVVPKLTEAFSDTHPKVKGSAEQALEEICKVIKNPEISSISPILLRALIDASGRSSCNNQAIRGTHLWKHMYHGE